VITGRAGAFPSEAKARRRWSSTPATGKKLYSPANRVSRERHLVTARNQKIMGGKTIRDGDEMDLKRPQWEANAGRALAIAKAQVRKTSLGTFR